MGKYWSFTHYSFIQRVKEFLLGGKPSSGIKNLVQQRAGLQENWYPCEICRPGNKEVDFRNYACHGGNTPGDMIVLGKGGRGENCLLYRWRRRSDLRPWEWASLTKSGLGAGGRWRRPGQWGGRQAAREQRTGAVARLQRAPEKWKVGAACSLYKERPPEFSSEGKGCDLIFSFKRSTCLQGNRRAEVEERRPMEKLF